MHAAGQSQTASTEESQNGALANEGPGTDQATSGGYKKGGAVNLRDIGVAFASGSIAGFGVKTLTAPLSRMTILLQVQGMQAPLAAAGTAAARQANATTLNSASFVAKPTSWEYLRSVYQREGLLSFWKGNWASIVHKSSAQGANYIVFEFIKDRTKPYLWRSADDPGFVARAFSGFAAGTVSLTLTYPFDVIRTRLAVEAVPEKGGSAPPRQGMIGTFRHVLAREGLRAFSRGLPCTWLCQGINLGLNFGIYESLNTSCLKPGETRTGFKETMACGAAAGLVTSVAVHPLDLIRRRQQLSCVNPTVAEIFQGILRQEGFRGLYRGLGPEIVKVVPAVGLSFFAYEYLRQEVFKSQVPPR
ncbi:hypothetical protein CYMTET_30505 [Cymbomonas tetramitiformis]|uniref:Mitochondrial carrier protein n=1 Tax=Cymbomonas tetramitiformis TaxID=36881 RepID=A0AAE0KU47_9CHLO|nr:hypothetical protein CYMTET_30505 [Cymbomonas tetramitiformis]